MGSAALLGGALLRRNAKAEPKPQIHNVNTNSSPSTLEMVEGIEKPIINKGYITAPDKPGLGITLNEEG